MTIMKKVTSSGLFMGKLSYDKDLLEDITEVCRTNKIKLGRIEALGAVQKACIGFYNQERREYEYYTLKKPLEITNLIGNVSLKNGNPIVHAHITLADKNGKAYGGHLAPGTIIFACELLIEVFDGPIFERGIDEGTGLPLWTMSE